MEQEARAAGIVHQRVGETAIGESGGKRIIEEPNDRGMYLSLAGIVEREDHVESWPGGVARTTRDKGREDFSRSVAGQGRIVVFEAVHRIPGEIVDRLDVLRERQRVKVVLVRAQIEAAQLRRPAGA